MDRLLVRLHSVEQGTRRAGALSIGGCPSRHGSTHRLQPHDALAAQIAQMLPAAVGPRIQVETGLAVFAHAVRLHDIAVQAGELLNDAGRIFEVSF